MVSSLPLRHLATSLIPLALALPENARAQSSDSVPQHVECLPLKPGGSPEAVGCTLLGERILTSLPRGPIYWHLLAFPTREAADTAAGSEGVVASVEGRHWVFAIAAKGGGPKGGERVARVGPLPPPKHRPFVLTAALAVLPPGARSRVHSHAGPEAWYMIAGSQCLETAGGVRSAGPKATMMQRGYTPMQLNVTGTEMRHSLLVVVHDSGTAFAAPAEWSPAGRCGAAAPPTRNRRGVRRQTD